MNTKCIKYILKVTVNTIIILLPHHGAQVTMVPLDWLLCRKSKVGCEKYIRGK
jgi:hypothetical protein